MKTRLMKRSVE